LHGTVRWRRPRRKGRFHQYDIGTLHRDIRASTDCEADIGLSQSRSVVHAVADHANLLALPLELLDLACLVAKQHVGEHSVDPKTFRNALCGALVVSDQHGDLDALRARSALIASTAVGLTASAMAIKPTSLPSTAG
jgi:hypothetical protein